MSVLAALIIALPAQGSAETKKATITVMKPGDLWLDDVQYTKVARGQRDGTWGYEVTYVLPVIGEKVLFWPRSRIDLDGSAPHKYRKQYIPLGKGRLLLPDRIITKSLPEVYRAILLLEGSYTKEARGNMVVAEAFATVTGLAAGLPGRAAAGVASRPAASSAATRAPVRPTAAKAAATRPAAAKPTVAKSTQVKPTSAKPNASRAAAQSSMNAARLAQQLRSREAAAIFTRAGGLQPEVIAKSRMIIPGNRLGNPELIKALISRGDKIGDWGKYATEVFKRPGGGRFEVHFYRNSVTGEIFYGMDYKAILLP